MRPSLAAGAVLSCATLLAASRVLAADRDPNSVVARAIEQARSDIDEARAKLTARRRTISDERIALTRKVAEMESAVQEKRSAARELLASRDDSDTALAQLRAKAESIEEAVRLARSVLVELRRGTEAALDVADANDLAGGFAEVDRLLAAAENDPRGLAEAASRLLGLVAGHVEDAGRIRRGPGRAIGPGGEEIEGIIVRIGGVQAFFVGMDAGTGTAAPAGIIRVKHGSPRPHFHPLAGSAAEQTARLARGEEAVVPVDLTSGAALRVSDAGRTFADTVRAGGVIMVPIILIGIVCLAFGAWKVVQLARVRTESDAPFARMVGLLRAGDVENAGALARATRPPLGRLLAEAAEHHSASRENLDEIMREAILAELPRLERHLSLLAVGAAVSPLLGLLGTVTGMIHTFSLIGVFGTGEARLLSGGISEALITTQAGLLVAIPLLVLHAFLKRRVNAITDGLEKGAAGFVNAIKIDDDERR